MNNIEFFFTPIYYRQYAKSLQQTFLEKFDNSLSFWGKNAYVISEKDADGREKVVLSESSSFLRVSVGKILVLFALAYAHFAIPVCLIITKVVLRSLHKFSVIDPKQELEKGIVLPDSTVTKIQEVMPQVLLKADHDKIDWISRSDIVEFKHKDLPGLIFKMAAASCVIFMGMRKIEKDNRIKYPEISAEKLTQEYFTNKIKAKETCLIHALDQLEIPSAKTIKVETSGKSYTLVVENHSNRELDKSLSVNIMQKTLNQMAIFLVQSNQNVTFKSDNQDVKGRVTVEHSVIDLKHSINESINHVMEALPIEQMGDWLEAAGNNHLPIEQDTLDRKEKRVKAQDFSLRLQKFYDEKNITSGSDLIQNVDYQGLGLDLSAEVTQVWHKKEYIFTLEQVLTDTLQEINDNLTRQKDYQRSVQGKRHFTLSTSSTLRQYEKLPYSENDIFTEEREKNCWLYKILQALVAKKYLFHFEINPYGYSIQA